LMCFIVTITIVTWKDALATSLYLRSIVLPTTFEAPMRFRCRQASNTFSSFAPGNNPKHLSLPVGGLLEYNPGHGFCCQP
jgi:hypothetical protein